MKSNLYKVRIEYEICVLAENESNAEYVAIFDGVPNEEISDSYVEIIEKLSDIPNDWKLGMPYISDSRYNKEGFTCAEYITNLEKEEEAKKPLVNPDQLELPLSGHIPNCS